MLFEKLRPATVRVESLDPRTHGWHRHRLFHQRDRAGADRLPRRRRMGTLFQISTLSGRSYSARVTAFDAAADVALLQVQGRGPFPAF